MYLVILPKSYNAAPLMKIRNQNTHYMLFNTPSHFEGFHGKAV